MNGIDKIADRIAEDARQETDAILANAETESVAITDKFAALAREESARILSSGQERAEEIRRRAASAAAQEGKQQLLATKQNMITRAFDSALQQIRSLPEKDYTALLARLAADAAVTGNEELILSMKDRESFGKAVQDGANKLLTDKGVNAKLSLSPATGSFNGGLLLKAGDVEVNCTFEAILRLAKEDLTFEIASALFS